MRTRRCGWTFCPFTQHLLVVLKDFARSASSSSGNIAVRICTTVQSSALETICWHKWFLRRVGSGMMRQAMPKAKAI